MWRTGTFVTHGGDEVAGGWAELHIDNRHNL